MRLQPEGLAQATRAINAALENLEIRRYRLDSITREPGANPDVDEYVLTLADNAEPGRTYTRKLGSS